MKTNHCETIQQVLRNKQPKHSIMMNGLMIQIILYGQSQQELMNMKPVRKKIMMTKKICQKKIRSM